MFFFVFLALISVKCVWTHIYVGGVVLQAYSSYAFTHSFLSISGFLYSHSLLLFVSLSFSLMFLSWIRVGYRIQNSRIKERPLIIIKNMIHGSCGSVNPDSSCLKDGKCTKRYPRKLLDDTQISEDGYPLYRRRAPENGGVKAKIKVKIDNSYREMEIDNKWVVLYCPLLSRIFQAHINVEYCNSVKSIKYICKYVSKGSDQAVFGLKKDGTAIDEVECYQLGRYISSNEALWLCTWKMVNASSFQKITYMRESMSRRKRH
jgi:hypothetical protein